MCVFSIYAVLRSNEALANTPAGGNSIIMISDIIRIIHFIATSMGCILSAKNKLTAKITGYIMCVPYVLGTISFLVTYVDMQIKNNGYMYTFSWLLCVWL